MNNKNVLWMTTIAAAAMTLLSVGLFVFFIVGMILFDNDVARGILLMFLMFAISVLSMTALIGLLNYIRDK